MRRRAAFLTSALAAVGCTPAAQQDSAQPQATPTTPVVTIPQATPAPTTTGPEVEPEPPAPKPSSGKRPPYDVPNGVSEIAKKNYERLHTTTKKLHSVLDEMDNRAPRCAIANASCEQEFRDEAERWHEIQRTLRMFYFCPGKSAEAVAFGKHRQAHDAHLRERIAAVDERIGRLAGDPKRWEQIKTEQAKPVPCLSFACKDW
jgi:hypothetical protein